MLAVLLPHNDTAPTMSVHLDADQLDADGAPPPFLTLTLPDGPTVPVTHNGAAFELQRLMPTRWRLRVVVGEHAVYTADSEPVERRYASALLVDERFARSARREVPVRPRG